MAFQLANHNTSPPNQTSYWVLPAQLLAGAYPGHPDPAEHQARVHTLVDAGIRRFINLMEEGETNHAGQAFASYRDVARQRCDEVVVSRFPIRDVSIPTASEMTTILDAIDQSLAENQPIYLHCWGGIGRTGTVVGCWMLRHKLAQPDNVLDLLTELRQQDQQRRRRMSPETDQQRQFVTGWSEPTFQA